MHCTRRRWWSIPRWTRYVDSFSALLFDFRAKAEIQNLLTSLSTYLQQVVVVVEDEVLKERWYLVGRNWRETAYKYWPIAFASHS